MSDNKRKRTSKGSNRFAILTVTFVVVILAMVLGIRVRRLKVKEQQYLDKEQALILQVAQEEERAQTLEEYRVYVQTKQYIEKVAKEKLGLVYENEIILKKDN